MNNVSNMPGKFHFENEFGGKLDIQSAYPSYRSLERTSYRKVILFFFNETMTTLTLENLMIPMTSLKVELCWLWKSVSQVLWSRWKQPVNVRLYWMSIEAFVWHLQTLIYFVFAFFKMLTWDFDLFRACGERVSRAMQTLVAAGIIRIPDLLQGKFCFH